MDIKLAGIEVERLQDAEQRMAVLLWGSAGCGKTTLAATAPGDILWINWDNDGLATVTNRDNIHVADFSKKEARSVLQFRNENPIQIEQALEKNPQIKTVVVDSVTSFGDKALQHGVVDAARSGATLEDPGFKGYGRKNVWTRVMVSNLLRATAKHNRHIIFICHEDNPTKNQDGVVMSITIMLGSSLAEEVPLQLSEVWHMKDTGKERKLAVRPYSVYKPMKTRMFVTNDKPQFEWKFDPHTWEGHTIEGWFEQWKANGFKKIALPT